MGWHSAEAAKRKAEAGAANIAKYHEEQGHDLVVAPVPQLKEPAAPAESTPAKEPEVIQPDEAVKYADAVREGIKLAGRVRRWGIRMR